MREQTAYFNKITEELVDPTGLLNDSDPFLRKIARAYISYRKTLLDNNRLDFAFQQKLLHDLLLKKEVLKKISKGIKYLLVDEYQDTNYIQEQILFKLASAGKQSLRCRR